MNLKGIIASQLRTVIPIPTNYLDFITETVTNVATTYTFANYNELQVDTATSGTYRHVDFDVETPDNSELLIVVNAATLSGATVPTVGLYTLADAYQAAVIIDVDNVEKRVLFTPTDLGVKLKMFATETISESASQRYYHIGVFLASDFTNPLTDIIDWTKGTGGTIPDYGTPTTLLDNDLIEIYKTYTTATEVLLGNPYNRRLYVETGLTARLYNMSNVEITGEVDKLSNYANMSNSITSYTGNLSGSTLTLSSSHDFVIGQGIAVKDAGTYRDGWLKTTVTNLAGNVVTLADSGYTVSSKTVEHDDTSAIQNAIDTTTKEVMIWDITHAYIHDLVMPSNLAHYGNGCTLYTPKYANATLVGTIWTMLRFETASNISMVNFNSNGGKLYGAGGNDQYGTNIIQANSISNALFTKFNVEENWYSFARHTGTVDTVSYEHCNIYQTDVGIGFQPIYHESINVSNIKIDNCDIVSVSCNSEAITFPVGYYKWAERNNISNVYTTCGNIEITNNNIDKSNRTGILVGALTDGMLIRGNTFNNTVGLMARDGVHGGSYGELRVQPNDGLGTAGNVDAGYCTTTDIHIENNTFTYCQWEAIIIDGGSWYRSGNTFTSVGGIERYQDIEHGYYGSTATMNGSAL
jgi:hypothetical protein